MIKEYKWIGNTYMTNLMIDVNKDACKGWSQWQVLFCSSPT